MKDAPLSTRLEYELDHLKSIFNEIGAYLFTKDLDGRYVYANQAVLDLFGCTLAELQGQDDSAFLTSTTRIPCNVMIVRYWHSRSRFVRRRSTTSRRPVRNASTGASKSPCMAGMAH